jgi:hypothetical protein
MVFAVMHIHLNLDFADDMCMLSHRYQDMQHQATSREEIAKQTCLLINPQKTKTMRINTTQTDKLKSGLRITVTLAIPDVDFERI